MNELAEEKRGVTGQQTLTGLEGEMGYGAINLLSPEHERFCWHFATYGNGRAAYQHAYPDATEPTARSESSRLLKNPSISQRLDEIRQEMRDRYADTAEDVIRYHRTVLRFDRNDLLNSDGSMKALDEIPMDIAAVLDVDMQVVGKHAKEITLLKVPERRGAATELARIQGLYNDKLQVTNDVATLTDEQIREELDKLAREFLAEVKP